MNYPCFFYLFHPTARFPKRAVGIIFMEGISPLCGEIPSVAVDEFCHTQSNNQSNNQKMKWQYIYPS